MKTIKLTVGLLAASVAATFTPAMAKDAKFETAKLEQMAESAQAPVEHVTVAKQYRLRAEEFEAKARKHEAEAQKMEARPRSALEHKWPAMSRQPWIKERQLAMEARRAAKESFEVADRHMRLSVEALAEASARRSTDVSSGSN